MSDDDRSTPQESVMNESSTQSADERTAEEPPADETEGGREQATDDERTESSDSDLVSERARRYFDYAVLVALGVLGFVALVQFYLSASNAINRWITPAYRSLFQAAFNLAVLLITGAAISLQFRRMGGD
jgi:hypothetical protein